MYTSNIAVTLANSILANTTTSSNPTYADCFGGGYSEVFTDVGPDTISTSVCGGATVADPLLGPLADNGGPTLTHALLPGSPAINAGDPGAASLPEFDQRGPGFPRVAAGRIDIGAFELPSSMLLAALGDINGDGTEDIAVLVYDALANTVSATIKDAEDDHLIQQISFNVNRVPVAFEAITDIDGNGAPELVVLSEDPLEAEIRDSLSGALQSTVVFNPANTFIDLAVLNDQNGNGASELAVLSQSTQGAVNVEIQDALTNQLLNNVGFNSNYTPVELAVLSNLNGNGLQELAVLGIDGNAAGKDKVEIRDSITGALLNNVFYGGGLQAKRLVVLEDQNNNMAQELVVLRQSTAVQARINDALNDALINKVGYSSSYIPRQIMVIPDLNGDGVPELGVLGTNSTNNRNRVQIKDALSDAKISNVNFSKVFLPQDDIAVMSDINANGSAELVYLGKRQSDGKLRAFIKDALTKVTINTVNF